MRFSHRKDPKHGTTRKRKCYAFFPTKLHIGPNESIYVWREYYYTHEEFYGRLWHPSSALYDELCGTSEPDIEK